MGSELIVTVLEMDKWQEPCWAAAEALLAAMSDEAVKSAYMEAMGLDEVALGEPGVEFPKMRTELQAAFDALHDAWDGAGGHIVRYPGARMEMLIGGGTSWGEDIEACNQINLFWESGMAAAAGFLAGSTSAKERSGREDTRHDKALLVAALTPMPCPACFEKVSLIDAADDTLEVRGDPYDGNYICPSCGTELAQVVPSSPDAGTPGWHWQRKVPVTGEAGRVFSDQALDLLVEEHDAIEAILQDPVARARRRTPPVINAGVHQALQLVSPATLAAYLERHGWTIDEGGTDEVHRSWEKPGGGICYTHAIPVADAEVMAWDVESVALGEDCSVLRVLAGLLTLMPPA